VNADFSDELHVAEGALAEEMTVIRPMLAVMGSGRCAYDDNDGRESA
jgi:hypothetical protein